MSEKNSQYNLSFPREMRGWLWFANSCENLADLFTDAI